MKFIPAKAMCARYGRSVRTIDRWVKIGELPKPIFIREQRFWDEHELDELDKARKEAAQ